MGELQVSQNSIAISRLTVQLDQIIQEKNDILAQFFGQQSLIKQQQSELKSLLRCKSENADLTSQTTAQNKTIHVSIYLMTMLLLPHLYNNIDFFDKLVYSCSFLSPKSFR